MRYERVPFRYQPANKLLVAPALVYYSSSRNHLLSLSLSIYIYCTYIMSVASSTADKTESSPPLIDSSPPSGRLSDGSMESPFSGPISSPATTPKQLELQRQMSQRSEEYRQLFRLPAEQVLIQDYNCALQENFLLQGHMYVFDHYICFYSNLFGFETKRVIPFHEVTAVRRAKSAGIFPTAIEIVVGEKKHFFTSFLSRDDAFKLVRDGWSQFGDGAKENTDLQGTKLELHSQENGDVVMEKASSSEHTVDYANFESQDIPLFEDTKIPVEDEIVSSSGVQGLGEDNVVSVVSNGPSPGSSLDWAEENCDAPKVSDLCTKVAELKFQISVEEFFSFFYSDDAVGFLKSYHQCCGDRDFRCNAWYPHEKFGHARDVSFQHPIKVYLGAKCGGCEEIQKYRVYKNGHLVIETSQNVKDVPYGDYFHVEGLWDVERDGDDSRRSCTVRVYVNVVFSKNTMFKGKIVQATIDEARDAYAIWIKNAHELLKQKKLEEEAKGRASDSILNGQVEEARASSGGTLEGQELASDTRTPVMLVGVDNAIDPTHVPLPESFNNASSFALFKESLSKIYASLKSRSQVPLLLVIAFAMILLLMQLSIIVLLSRPQKVRLVPQLDYPSYSSERKYEMIAWMGKRIQHFKEEMLMIESVIEKMRHEHKILNAQLEDLEHFRRLQME